MFFSIEQVKAARALLKWTQKDLAKNAGLKDDQIYNYEAGRSRSPEILEAVFDAITREGLVFSEDGVIRKQVSSYVLDSYMDLLNDISEALPEGGEVLKHCVDDRRSTPEVIEKTAAMRKIGIAERKTISDNIDFVSGDPKDYRQIPGSYVGSSEVIIIYLNKVAFFVEGKVLVIVSDTLSKVFRDQFEYWWREGRPVDV